MDAFLTYGKVLIDLGCTEEEEKFMKEAKKLGNEEEVFELTVSYEEKGKEIGKEIGRQEAKRDLAQKLLQDGFSIEKIIELTELSEDEIKKLDS